MIVSVKSTVSQQSYRCDLSRHSIDLVIFLYLLIIFYFCIGGLLISADICFEI